ncbi:MAG: hypothetical protein ABWY25_07975, partial [Paenisporosarcina sp.]
MKKLESSNEKNVGATNKTVATVTLMMLVFVAMVSLHSTSNTIIPDIAPQLAVAEEAQLSVNNIKEMNFSSPFNNSFNLGTPFLVEYDDTTSLKAIENAPPKSFDVTFEGHGIVNGLKYKDNGAGIFLTDPIDGSIYQKGVIELRTDNDTIQTTYESMSRKSDNGIVLDNGIMVFNASS